MPNPASRRTRLELAVFLLFVLPSIVLSPFVSSAGETFLVIAYATIFHGIALTALAVFFVWSGGEPLSALGWTRRGLGKEAALGAVLFLPMLVLVGILEILAKAAGLGKPGAPAFLVPRSTPELALAVLLVAVVACAEETIFRGYLLLRLRAITRSTTAAVVLATLVFASGHLYSGRAGVLGVAVMGVVFALVYLWRKSLVAPIVMHFLQDLLSIVIAPLMLHADR